MDDQLERQYHQIGYQRDASKKVSKEGGGKSPHEEEEHLLRLKKDTDLLEIQITKQQVGLKKSTYLHKISREN
jgi:hypothetical protein